MKQLEFPTSKGEFLVLDEEFDILLPKDGQSATLSFYEGSIQVFNPIKLSEITEEQASEIVDETLMWKKHKVKCYRYISYIDGFVAFDNAIESLHSLLKSKGIHLFENPYKDHKDKDLEAWYNDLTFYNPYIFTKRNK